MKPNLSFTVRSMILFTGVALLPIYVFQSGGVQPAHLVLALFTGIILTQSGLRSEPFFWFLLGLSVWVLVTESIHAIAQSENLKGIRNFLYFFYNYLITQAIKRYVKQDGMTPVVAGLMVAASIATISIGTTGVNLQDLGEDGRETATFNNPNQLGFFSVCLMAMTYFFYVSRHVIYVVALSLFATALSLSILSLSKAAMIANGLVLFIVLKPKLNRITLPIFVFAMTGVAYFIYFSYLNGSFDQFLFVQRLSNIMHENDSSLESRGYFAFLEGSVLEILFGMGSVAIERILGHEVHSTFGSVANNFGLVGLGLIIGALSIWASRIYQHFGLSGLVCIVGPPILYGITHNGTRFVIFWILVATTLGYIERTGRVSPQASKTT